MEINFLGEKKVCEGEKHATQKRSSAAVSRCKQTNERKNKRTKMTEDEELEEQLMEVEALKSIFMDDMREVEEDGNRIQTAPKDAICWEIVLSPLGDGEDASEMIASEDLLEARLGVVFAHSKRYPNEIPHLKCRSVAKIHDEECERVTKRLLALAEKELVGAPMIYDLVEHAREWLRTRTNIVEVEEETEEDVKKRLEFEAEERLKAMRETGTPVTRENFERWAKAFDAERAMAKATTKSDGGSEGNIANSSSTITTTATKHHAQQGAVSMSGRRFFEERYEALRKSGKEEDEDEDAEEENGGGEEEFKPDSEDEDEEIGVREEEEEEDA